MGGNTKLRWSVSAAAYTTGHNGAYTTNPTRNSKQQGGRKVETAAATGHGRGHIVQGSATAAPVIESLRHAATKEHC